MIQKIRSGKQTDLKINNFVSIAHACGYQVILEKEHERIFVEEPHKHKQRNPSLHFISST